MQAGLNRGEFNLGTGRGYSNLQVLNMVKTVTGLPLPYEATPRRPGDLSQLYADASRARDILGFTLKSSSLENIIATAWNFHKKAWEQ